jgi:hypothetical protein
LLTPSAAKKAVFVPPPEVVCVDIRKTATALRRFPGI